MPQCGNTVLYACSASSSTLFSDRSSRSSCNFAG
jgi:hypothetical protein